MSLIYKNTITPQHEKLMDQLSNLFDRQLLIGGTGLALQIGHRKSEDLDYVVFKSIPADITTRLKHLTPGSTWQHRLQNDQQYTGFCDGLKITFFHDPVEFLHPPIKLGKTLIVAVPDIFSSKLFTIGRRAVWRDYVDIAIILDHELVSLEQGINEAHHRHSVVEKWILEPLTYFADVLEVPIEYIEQQYSRQQIEAIIEREVGVYLDRKLAAENLVLD